MLGQCLLFVIYMNGNARMDIDIRTPVTEVACLAAGHALLGILGDEPKYDGEVGIVWSPIE